MNASACLQNMRRRPYQSAVMVLLWFSAFLAVLLTLAIIGSVLTESYRFFTHVPFSNFLFGLSWSPQAASHGDAEAVATAFGAVPLFLGTFMITLIALIIAVPVGLFAAIYLAEYATPRARGFAKPVLELLAGIPTVVYGYVAIISVAPLMRALGETIGVPIAAESALTAGIVMGVMIIPFISSLADDMITAVPRSLRDASYGLGATKAETITSVVLPSALPGLMGAVLLAVSRAVGETMIVVMAAGLAANLTFNPLESMTTVTVQIVTLLIGDQEFDSPKTLAAFALGLSLFVFTLLLNIIALRIVKKYKEQYE